MRRSIRLPGLGDSPRARPSKISRFEASAPGLLASCTMHSRCRTRGGRGAGLLGPGSPLQQAGLRPAPGTRRRRALPGVESWGPRRHTPALGRGVAQSGSALRSGRRGRWFESSRPDQGFVPSLSILLSILLLIVRVSFRPSPLVLEGSCLDASRVNGFWSNVLKIAWLPRNRRTESASQPFEKIPASVFDSQPSS